MEAHESDWKQVTERYADRFSRFGYSEQAVGWGAKGRQQLRYEVLLAYWGSSDGLSVLDLGAGFGDGCTAFFAAGGESYHGLELSAEFVKTGKERFRHYGNRFRLQQANLAEQEVFPEADLIIGSGLFNSRLNNLDNYQFISSTLQKAFNACKVGVAFNFLSDATDFKEDYIFYSSPTRVLATVEGLSRNFCLKKDYFPFEFSIYVSKDDSFRKATSIFSRPKFI